MLWKQYNNRKTVNLLKSHCRPKDILVDLKCETNGLKRIHKFIVYKLMGLIAYKS